MHRLLDVLQKEKKRVEDLLETARQTSDTVAQEDCEKRLKVIHSDIDRIEQYIDRPTMQTFSELNFIGDIQLRVNRILEAAKNQENQ